MSMVDFIIAVIVLSIVGGAAFYICRAKKNGAKCIGCPNSKTCGCNCGGHCGHK